MAKSKRRKKQRENQRKKRKDLAAYYEGKGKSKYARKREYCIKNEVWGFEVPSPKPWGR